MLTWQGVMWRMVLAVRLPVLVWRQIGPRTDARRHCSFTSLMCMLPHTHLTPPTCPSLCRPVRNAAAGRQGRRQRSLHLHPPGQPHPPPVQRARRPPAGLSQRGGAEHRARVVREGAGHVAAVVLCAGSALALARFVVILSFPPVLPRCHDKTCPLHAARLLPRPAGTCQSCLLC